MSSAKTIAIGSGDRTLAIVSVAVSAKLRGLNSAIATADSEVTIDLQPCSSVVKEIAYALNMGDFTKLFPQVKPSSMETLNKEILKDNSKTNLSM